MDPIILSNIVFTIDRTQLLARLRIPEGSEYTSDLLYLADQAEAIAKPKAMYKLSSIEAKGDDYVVLDGVKLTSRVLRVNLDRALRAFPYVATCGMELQSWSDELTDWLHRFWADTIKALALQAAVAALNADLEERFRPGKTARMSPGSLSDWPLREQRALFAALGDVSSAIGVLLTDSFLMIPNKSVSGIRFPTEESFESCLLCPRENCPGRRAAYDPELYERKYRM